jgi:hypothetical protein
MKEDIKNSRKLTDLSAELGRKLSMTYIDSNKKISEQTDTMEDFFKVSTLGYAISLAALLHAMEKEGEFDVDNLLTYFCKDVKTILKDNKDL